MNDKAKGSTRGGLDTERLDYLKSVVEEDIARGRYLGAQVAIGRHGEVGLHWATGHGDAEKKKPLKTDSIISLFSTTKAFTNALVFRAIELGQFSFTTKVSEIIPEFGGGLRQHVTFYHLLTHSSGLPSVYSLGQDHYIDRLDEVLATIYKTIHSIEVPGVRVDYSPLVHHALMADAVRRTDPKKRSYRQLVEDEILKPLGMKDTAVGVRRDLKARHFPPVFLTPSPAQHLGHSNLGPNGAFEEENAEMPWVGVISTAGDMYRFAEMLRRGGELDGARVLSPTLLRAARRNQTGEKPNELYKSFALSQGWEPFPAYIGLGFSLRGTAMCHHLFGTLTSPETFGHYGFGATLFWVDPELDLSFVLLTTGVMDRAGNFERCQKLSDIAVSAAI